MSNKYFGGVVKNSGVTDHFDEELKALTLETPKKVAAKMEDLRVADAISEIFMLFKRCNKYIDETMPWVLAKEEASTPGVLVCDVDLTQARDDNHLRDRRPELYDIITVRQR